MNSWTLFFSFLQNTQDTEWGSDGRGVALVQIGTMDQVWLLDIMGARKNEEGQEETATFRNMLSSFLCWVFGHERIVKLGFSFEHDFEQLEKVFPGLKDLSSSICDLQSVHTKSMMTRGGGQAGLSDVVSKYFGCPLNKTEQCSEWCHRPLCETQKLYAALDAVVLVDLACAMKFSNVKEEIC